MPGFDPGIHADDQAGGPLDSRVKPENDYSGSSLGMTI